jgi:hypothetical protein
MDDMPVAPRPRSAAWQVVRSPVIGEVASRRVRVDVLAAHPSRGVALIDIAPGHTPKAAATFRCRLEIADFAALHPGTLPIVYCRLDAADLARLPRLLDEALPPEQTLRDAGDWVPSLTALVQPAPASPPNARRRAPVIIAGAAALAALALGLTLFSGGTPSPTRVGMVAPAPDGR